MTSARDSLVALTNGGVAAITDMPAMTLDAFSATILAGVEIGQRVAALFGVLPVPGGGTSSELFVVLADDANNRLFAARAEVHGDEFPSLSQRCPQVQLFEREIAEQIGLRPEGHPWLKPVRFRHSWTARDAWNRPEDRPILPAVGDFYRLEGTQVHEVAVGPVHAGVIEPGHFRFQCVGERVVHLEIALGYQHRGVEEALAGGPDTRSIHYAETLAGDTTVAHALAYCHSIGALARVRFPARAQVLSGIALELERLANHVGDIGALSGDVGFLPTASYCGRIRGDFLNMTALLCGNRFGRGMITVNGVGYDIDDDRIAELLRRLDCAERDLAIAVNLLWKTQSVMARFEDTGTLSSDAAKRLGVVGPAARASGLVRDVRFDQPSGIYRMAQIPVSTFDSGDVFSRATVRWMEMRQSIAFIREQLNSLPSGAVRAESHNALAPNSLAVSLVEGWRGEVCHVVLTDGVGKIRRYKIVDPSFHNWSALAYAMRNQEISDFPLCNKSFNLSYCGHDL